MKHNGLAKALKEVGINLPRSRLNFLSMLLMGIVEAGTVNLETVVETMQSRAQQASVYRRAQRFFAELALDETLFTSLVALKTRFTQQLDVVAVTEGGRRRPPRVQTQDCPERVPTPKSPNLRCCLRPDGRW